MYPMVRFTLLLVILLALSCHENSTEPGTEAQPWQTIQASTFFTFSLPPEMTGSCDWGIDSFVGVYNSNSMRLSLDLGNYSGGSSWSSFPEFRDTTLMVSGRVATEQYCRTSLYDSTFQYIATIYFYTVSDTLSWHLAMYAFGKAEADQDNATRVFRSIKFTM